MIWRLVMINLLISLTILLLPFYNLRFHPFGIPFSLIDLVLAATVIVWLIKEILTKFKGIKEILKIGKGNQTFVLALLAFIMVGLISTLISPDRLAALGDLRSFIVLPILLFLMILAQSLDPKTSVKIYWSLLA